MPFIAHTGLDYAVLLADGETTDNATANFRDGKMAAKVAALLNAKPVRVTREGDHWLVTKPNGQRLDQRKTYAGAIQLACKLFPSSPIHCEASK